MATRIEPQIFSREVVKPTSTGFDHPKSHTLSFFDQLPPSFYISHVYFYASGGENKSDFHRSDLLKKSLSSALALYYPLAGRRNSDNISFDCNDEGVMFLEARISCSLSEVLKNWYSKEDTANQLFPDGLQYKDSNLSCPLVVQATYFDCGGMAIAICLSHSLMDMSSICYFFNEWASLARKSGVPEEMTRPEFNFATLYPTTVRPPAVKLPTDRSDQSKLVKIASRTFVIDDASIAKLKAAVEKKMHLTPTRLEVAQALVFKCAVSAAARARSSSGLIKPAAMHQPVNLRTRVLPPLPETAMGNFIGSFPVSMSREEITKLDWIDFVGKIRNEKRNFLNELEKNCRGEELISFLLKTAEWMRGSGHDDEDVYICTNWCRFPIYEADFGWGKPTWVTPARRESKNIIQMLDTKEGDGIEVLMILEEQHMNFFESDQELLAFATLI